MQTREATDYVELKRRHDMAKMLYRFNMSSLPDDLGINAVMATESDVELDVELDVEPDEYESDPECALWKGNITEEQAWEMLFNKHKAIDVLDYAISQNKADIVRECLDKDPSIVNLPTSAGHPLLFRAVMHRNAELVNFLLRYGADINAPCGPFGTCLHVAALFRGMDDVLKLLVEKGADRDICDDRGFTALSGAIAARASIGVIMYLVEKQTKPGDMEQQFFDAAMENDCGALRSVVATGSVDVNATDGLGSTALHFATASNNVEAVQTLVDLGADVSAKTVSGLSPLHMAASVEAASLLLDNGADPRGKSNTGSSALHCTRGISNDALELLLNRGAKEVINDRDEDGCTPAYLAARHNHRLLPLLVQHGADLRIADATGSTILHAAAANSSDAVKMVIELGIYNEIRNSRQQTPLLVAANAAVADALLSHGAGANVQDSLGYTTLHRAAQQGNEALVRLLITRGADKTIKNFRKQIAEDAARAKEYLNIVSLLQPHEK